ncbi:TIR domain-containing protein [Nonomuraea sp. NPDC050663]|uniref:TIR domain-containing protein n=1 Tax=Nonomuraea sp. NPDC050663 TaxID=3364370 RepID=UPI00378A445D
MVTNNAAGFWSYTHRDNEAEGGRLQRLALRVREEFDLLTGEELNIFVDREGIAWGDQWRQRIDQALQSTTFFIPVITPRYLQSSECRRELLHFVGKAESLGLKELFLPIVYAPIKQLDDKSDSDDEIVNLLRRTLYSDWRKLRLLDENSAAYREAINTLATRLVDIAHELEENPPELPTAEELANAHPADTPGIVDVMADAEGAMPAWAQSMEDLIKLMTELKEVVEPVAARLQESDREGKGFAGRLLLLRDLAGEMDPLADRLMFTANRYADQVVTINPAVLAAIRELEEESATSTSTPEERAAFVAILNEFANAMGPVVGALDELVQHLDQSKGLSRDLAKPVNKMTRAVSFLRDSHSLMEQWTTSPSIGRAPDSVLA